VVVELVMFATRSRSDNDSYSDVQSSDATSDCEMVQPPSVSAVRRTSNDNVYSSLGGQRGSIFSDHMLPITKTINDPIQCGYFLAFCEQEHSLENLLFVMEVDRCRDDMKVDKKCWLTKWKEIDSTVFTNFVTNETFDIDPVTSKKSVWPSKIVQRRQIERNMKEIWDTYLSDSAPRQICISHNMRSRTKTRMDLVHLYGPSVFNEALYDPLATLRNDTLPRFKSSALFQAMSKRMDYCLKLPRPELLVLPPPRMSSSPFRGIPLESLPDTRQFDLKETLDDPFLMKEFLNYSREIFACENLQCIRKIMQFEDLMVTPLHPYDGNGVTEEAETCAWEIYVFFVATGSPFEITLSVRQRKDVMISLAKPSSYMFKVLYETTMGHLVSNFNSYKFTDRYVNSCKRLKDDIRSRRYSSSQNASRKRLMSKCFF
jgi:Regulator of G protein signaling domain